MRYASVLPHRGRSSAWPAEQIALFLKDIGYKRVVAKSDQEPAILSLIDNLRGHGIQTIPAQSPVGESKAHGTAEQSVQAVGNQLRTMKRGLERRLGIGLPVQHAFIAWLLTHAAETLNRYNVNEAGRAPYFMWKGRPYRGDMLEVGCQCFVRLPAQRGGVMGAKWAQGA